MIDRPPAPRPRHISSVLVAFVLSLNPPAWVLDELERLQPRPCHDDVPARLENGVPFNK